MSVEPGNDILKKIQILEKDGVVLSMLQKVLLAETGTVEHVLGMLTGTRVIVNVVGQREEKGIIRRQAMLLSDSGQPLIRASSKIYCKNLPPTVVEKIRLQKLGIGTIISTARLEIFREITQVGIKDGIPYRKYRVFHRKRITFEIMEEILLKGGPGGI